MHKLTNWVARRSGAQITVQGLDESGERVKVSAVSVDGPNPARILAPRATVAIKPDGTPVALEGAPMSQEEKVKRVGGAVVKLEAELISEGKSGEASALVAAFAKLPPPSMATLHDLLI